MITVTSVDIDRPFRAMMGSMRITWDREVDAAYLYLTSIELAPGRDTVDVDGSVLLDWKDGRIVGIEVLTASVLLHPDLLAGAEILE